MCSVVCSDDDLLQKHVELHLDHAAGKYITIVFSMVHKQVKVSGSKTITDLVFPLLYLRESCFWPGAGQAAAAARGGAEEEAGGGPGGKRVQEAAGVD